MKKSAALTVVSVVALVPMALLAISINENKAEQQAINAVPQIKKFESRSSEWGKYYQRQKK
jgi:nitrite reductase (cytochrome c-552)